MSQENVEVIRTIYDRWNRNDGDLASDLFHPEVEIRQMASLLDTAGTFQGHEGLLRSARELRHAFRSIEWVADRWTEGDEWSVVWVRAVAVGRHSGVETETYFAHAWRVRDGRVTDLCVYEDEAQALAAAGLSE
jgi:ketosteroid isomerase-like protein